MTGMNGKDVSDVIEFLKEWDDSSDWREIEFTEVHLGDIKSLRSYVEYPLNEHESPIFRGHPVSEDELNQIGRAVRRYIRSERGLPPAPEDKLAEWSFEPQPGKRFENETKVVASKISIPKSRFLEIRDKISSEYPDALPFRRNVLHYMKTEEGKSRPIVGVYYEQCMMNVLYDLLSPKFGQMWHMIDIIYLREFIDLSLNQNPPRDTL